MICNECGREMPETDKFCVICGTPNPLFQSPGQPAQNYEPYTAEPDPADMVMSGGKARVKRTCSLSAVIFCGIVIFFLSVACGIFAGLYFSARSDLAAYSAAEYEDS